MNDERMQKQREWFWIGLLLFAIVLMVAVDVKQQKTKQEIEALHSEIEQLRGELDSAYFQLAKCEEGK